MRRKVPLDGDAPGRSSLHADPMHTGGVGAVDDDGSDAAPSTTSTAALLAQQFFQDNALTGGATGGSGASSVPQPLPSRVAKEPNVHAVEAEVRALFAASGDAAVQDRLRVEIQKTKKLESEIAITKKRADAAAREKDALALEHAKSCHVRDTLKLQCQSLLSEIERLEPVVQSDSTEDSSRREEIRHRIEKEIVAVNAKIEEQAAERRTLEAENVTLKEEFDKLRAEFETTFNDFQEKWRVREVRTRELIGELTQVTDASALARALTKEKEAALKEVQLGTASLQGQLDLYAERFTEFESVATQSASVYDVTSKQDAAFQARIQEFDRSKREDQEALVKATADTARQHQLATTLKKKCEKLNSSKIQKEDHCRKLHAKLKAAQSTGKAEGGEAVATSSAPPAGTAGSAAPSSS